MTELWFPIQGERIRDESGNRREAGRIPWGVAAAAYEVYARRYGTSQSLVRIAERGGFGWSELIALLRDDETCPTLPFAEPLKVQP